MEHGDTMRPLSDSMQLRRSAMRGAPAQSTWRTVFSRSDRPLLVPHGDRRSRRTALQFFATNPLRHALAHFSSALASFSPPPQAASYRSLLTPELAERLAVPDAAQFAVQIGTPGPYRKATVLMMSAQGAPLAVAKISLGAKADAMVDREARWLEELDHHQSMRARCPRLLATGIVDDGRRYVLMSALQGDRPQARLSAAHLGFLGALAVAYPQSMPMAGSEVARYMRQVLIQLQPMLEEAQYRLLLTTLTECHDRLHDAQPFVLAHGDFTKWNLRLLPQGMAAFDWEYAREGMSALHDAFHYMLTPASLKRAGITPRQLERTIEQARYVARTLHPGHDWTEATVGAHALVYLLYVVLSYAMSRGYLMCEDPVIRNYLRLIEARAQWLH